MLYTWHSAEWYMNQWLKTEQVTIEVADSFEE
jgi:hypothetical protein